MLNVCLVWTNKKYPVDYVNNMVSMIRRNMPDIDYEIVLFTDKTMSAFDSGFDGGIIAVNEFGLNGWWNKLLLFNWKWHQLEDKILYFDLDMVIVNKLDYFCSNNGVFTTGYRFAKPNDSALIGSTLMSIPAEYGQWMWDKYKKEGSNKRGDQEYLQDVWMAEEHWNKKKLISYKWNCKNGLPKEAIAVSFHGRPDPHEVGDDWVKENWRSS